MRVGFTGTQEGMSQWQAQFVFDEMMMLAPLEAHHGCCVGADAEFHDMLGYSHAKVHGHPPLNTSKMARCHCDVMHPAKDYLVRNHDIVDACEWLIAAPKGPEEQRSGTWATVRYARKVGRPISIVWPDGNVTRERVKEAAI